MEIRYNYAGLFNVYQLQDELVTAAIYPLEIYISIDGRADGLVTEIQTAFDPPLTASLKSLLESVIAAHVAVGPVTLLVGPTRGLYAAALIVAASSNATAGQKAVAKKLIDSTIK